MKKTVRVLVGLVMALMMVLMTSCGGEIEKVMPQKSLTYGDITEENLPAVVTLLENAGFKNTDVFKEWVEIYLAGSESDKKESGFADASCRMLVMLLAGDEIQFRTVENEYEGDYLMFDLNVIDNVKEYSILKSKEGQLTTLFGEMPISIKGYIRAYPENLRRHGIKFNGDKCSVISIVFRTDTKEDAFVGHTGLLIDCRSDSSVDSDYVFLEKIAFGEPYRITQINSDDELLQMFSERSEYTVEKGEPEPLVYKDGRRIGKL